MNPDGVKLLREKVTEHSLELNSANGWDAGDAIFKEVIREMAPNKIANPQYCKQTRYNYMSAAGVVKNDKGDVKNEARQKAYLNIRTPLSFAAMMRCVHKLVHPRLIHSSDDFSLLLNGFDEKPTLLTTKEGRKVLKELNMGVSTTRKKGKRRVVTLNCTISYFGVTCKVLRFSDKNFTDQRKAPKVFDMGDKFFVVLHHPLLPEKKVTEVVYLKCIIPSALEVREQAMRKALEPIKEIVCSESSQSQSQALSQASLHDSFDHTQRALLALQRELEEEEEQEEAHEQGELEEEEEEEEEGEEEQDGGDDENDTDQQPVAATAVPSSTVASDFVKAGDLNSARTHLRQYAHSVPTDVPGATDSSATAGAAVQQLYDRTALLFDGAIPQIQALLGKVNSKCIKLGLPVVMGKTPGGASPATGTNDAGDMHKGSHKSFGSAIKGYKDYPEPDKRNWQELKEYLNQRLDGDSFRTLWQCCRAAPHILPDTFKVSSLQKAFNTAGTLVVRDSDKALVPDDVTILSHCPAFNKLNDQKAAFVLSSVPIFAQLMERDGYIDEDDFQRVLSGEDNVDNCPPKTGKPLGLMSTSRQRACIVNSTGWLEHLQLVEDYAAEREYQTQLRKEQRENKRLREEEEEAKREDTKKKKAAAPKVRGYGTRCFGFPHCPRFKGDDDAACKDCKGWIKCPRVFCREWACPSPQCRGVLQMHTTYDCEREMPQPKKSTKS